MNVATETTIETVTETSAEIVITIDGVTFTADEAATLYLDMGPRTRMASNTEYHKFGKPDWWIKIGSTYLAIEVTRAVRECPGVDVEEVLRVLGTNMGGSLLVGYGTERRRGRPLYSFKIQR